MSAEQDRIKDGLQEIFVGTEYENIEADGEGQAFICNASLDMLTHDRMRAVEALFGRSTSFTFSVTFEEVQLHLAAELS